MESVKLIADPTSRHRNSSEDFQLVDVNKSTALIIYTYICLYIYVYIYIIN